MEEQSERRRIDQRVLDRIETLFAGRSRLYVLAVGILFVVMIGGIDALTGYLSLSIFYVLPVVLLAWLLGRAWGSLVAVVASTTWFVADVLTIRRDDGFIPYWNWGARFAVFFLVASLVNALRNALYHEHDLAMHEREISEGLRGLNEMKDTLLHAVSHDLRNPLTAIMGSVQTLERGQQLRLTPDQSRGLLNAIDASARKLHKMINDLLDLDRLDRGDVEAQRRPTDIRALVRRLIHEADFLERHPARVESERVTLDVDEGKVERIIENLLVNAAKYTPVGSPVCVSVKGLPDGVLISVDDEGPGVPDDMKELIFQAFRQGPDGAASGSGAGVGLSLVARFAELHAGRAWVEDRPGGGASFKVYLAAPPEETEGPALRLVQ